MFKRLDVPKLIRIYKASNAVLNVSERTMDAKRGLDEQFVHVDKLIDAEAFAKRVIRKEVVGSDVRDIGRYGTNAAIGYIRSSAKK